MRRLRLVLIDMPGPQKVARKSIFLDRLLEL